MNQIDIKSTEYPYLLKQIKDPPETLYYRGKWNPEIFKQTLSVVGSRKMTRYGEAITKEIVTDAVSAGITIVSGFMYGIDAQAHEGALNASGHTIAVMPCGIDRIHPEYQADLYKKIEKEKGLILSEYPEETPPALWTYPRRNRIIAGLSPILLVIEAGLKSGALITARIAQKYNKKIFAVPGPLTSSVSEGTSLLIKEGASIFTKSDDLLSEFGIGITGTTKNKKQTSNLNQSQRKIMELLSRQPMGIDEIIRILKKPTSKVGADLTFLSLKKMIGLHDGKYTISRNKSAGNRIC